MDLHLDLDVHMLHLIKNIGCLVQADDATPAMRAGSDMQYLPMIRDAFLLTENGTVKDFGEMTALPSAIPGHWTVTDAAQGWVFPCFADSHTHIVYAAPREAEFVDKIRGLSYEEIARRGGGILQSAARLAHTSEDALYASAKERLHQMIAGGTGAVEIKSGYGLTTAAELKMLRVIKRLKETMPITIRATFLGAHALPAGIDRHAYIRMVVEEMIPAVAKEGLAEYCDVFCDRGFFSPEETALILTQGRRYGLIPKIHANELDFSGGVQVAVAHQARSVDHLEYTGEAEIAALKDSGTMPTLLPGTAFFLRLIHPPARQMMEAGLPLALASDFNPGSCPSGNMSFVLSLACIQLRMLPEEAINAATLNGAYAMQLEESHGHLRRSGPANFFLTRPMPSLAYLPYAFGESVIESVYLNGRRWSH